MAKHEPRDKRDDVTLNPGQQEGGDSYILTEPLIRFIYLLDQAEQEVDSLPVKWETFLGAYLTQVRNGSSNLAADADRVLLQAFLKGIAWTPGVYKGDPGTFRASSVRLNRTHLEVEKVLGRSSDQTVEFEPVVILGEPLSDTVIRDRR